jgi:hypothetical protein
MVLAISSLDQQDQNDQNASWVQHARCTERTRLRRVSNRFALGLRL